MTFSSAVGIILFILPIISAAMFVKICPDSPRTPKPRTSDVFAGLLLVAACFVQMSIGMFVMILSG